MTEQCIRCNDTGEVDSGGVDPQGNFIQIPCQCQTEHECEWGIGIDEDIGGVFIICDVKGCSASLEIEQAEDRLNEYETLKKATEALTADRARQLSDDLDEAQQTPSGAVMELYHDDINAIKAYADILSGEDDGRD